MMMNLVLACKPRYVAAPVLIDAPQKIVCHTDVKCGSESTSVKMVSRSLIVSGNLVHSAKSSSAE